MFISLLIIIITYFVRKFRSNNSVKTNNMVDETSSSKVVLILGGSSPIGSEIAKLYASKGYRVAIHGTNQERIDLAVKYCNQVSVKKQKALGINLKIVDPDEAKIVIQKTIDEYERLDILITAVVKWEMSELGDFEGYLDIFRMSCDVNIKATLAAIPHLSKTKGSIVHILSANGTICYYKQFAIAVAKKSLLAFSRAMAIELAEKGIRVNSVSPGPIDTPTLTRDCPETANLYKTSTLLNKLGSEKDVANAVEFLTSDKANYITGHDLVVDGGITFGSRIPDTHTKDF